MSSYISSDQMIFYNFLSWARKTQNAVKSAIMNQLTLVVALKKDILSFEDKYLRSYFTFIRCYSLRLQKVKSTSNRKESNIGMCKSERERSGDRKSD